ncbi:MAG: type IV pilus assembly protein PilM [Parcubacteria group bacterium Gr01-1014_38]|nr:MAG: type IV pilus assembly protein PilM [Parcubacteria group bacterium Gr01-1014_38]
MRLFQRAKPPKPPSSIVRAARRLASVLPEPSVRVRLTPVSRAFGLDISDTSLEGMELEFRRGSLKLRAYNRVLLDAGVVVDGEILQAQSLRSALLSLLKGARPSSFSGKAVVTLPESKVYLHTFEFPTRLRERQIREAIPFEVQGVLPVDLADMETDLLFHHSRDRLSQHVLFAAVPRKLVESYLSLLTAAGIEAVAFDIESYTLARSLIGLRSDPVLLADLGAQRTTLAVVERGGVHGAVSIPVGGTTITEAIKRAAGVSPEEAGIIKGTTGLTAETPAAVRSAIEESLRPLFHEMNQVLRSHEGHTGRKAEGTVLAGGSALLPGLDAAVADATGRTASVGDPFATPAVQFPAQLSEADIEWLQRGRLFFAASVGLAIRGARRNSPEHGVNLLPHAFRQRYVRWRENLALTALSLLTVAVCTSLFVVLGLELLGARFAARSIRAEAEPVRAALQSTRFSSAVAEAKAVNQEVEAVKSFSAHRVDPLHHLERIRSAIPLGIRLIGVQAEIPPGSLANLTVKLQGVADTREQFLDFEKSMRALPGILGVDSPLTNLDKPTAVPFVLNLTLATSPPSPTPSPVLPSP